MRQSTRQAWLARATPLAVFALVVLAQWPLVSNPGYFSHDELQWAARAGEAGPIPWQSWTAVDTFQYRPLTFNLWLWLSRQLFAQPPLLHAVLVGWGAANATLLMAVARRFGVARWPAACAALVFALGPFGAYVHGWVGTIADLAWVSCALLAGWLLARARSGAQAAVIAAITTATALLAKEAALAIPALLALAWWFGGRQRTWLVATLASAGVAAVYLALRSDALLHAPREGAQYSLALANIPRRWLEYQLYPAMPQKLETFSTLRDGLGGSAIASAVLWVLLVLALWRSNRRLAALFVLGGAAALAPVVPLASSWTQYGYGFAAVTAAVTAAAWPLAPRWGRAVIAAAAVLCVWHGFGVMRQMRHAGEVQAVFSPALADALQHHEGTLRLSPANPADAWIYMRLSHAIPEEGAQLDRVRVVAPGTAADFLVAADGRLVPAR